MSLLVLPSRFPFDDPALPYRVDPMQVSDLRQVMDIEREAFPSPWPVSAYRYELTQNELSTYRRPFQVAWAWVGRADARRLDRCGHPAGGVRSDA
jgi:ribosomal protein S18 acetylase RimI-like enzyme